MEDYYQAKRRLFTGAQPPPAAVNVGDEHGRRLALELAEARRAPLVTFGLDRRGGDPAGGARGRRRPGAGSGQPASTSRRRCGGASTSRTCSASIAAGILLDIDEDDLAEGMRAMRGVPGRFEAVDEGQPFAVIVDYAHTPDSLDIVLQAARELGDGPR